MPVHIRDLVARRSDLGTFLVHLTRDGDDQTARERFERILIDETLRARSMFGPAKDLLEDEGFDLASQRCVCFTETPLEHIHLLLADIENRECRFRPYGIAMTKKVGRQEGINPIWYLDITPGHDWLAVNFSNIVERSLDLTNGRFTDRDVERLAPFIEQMGSGRRADGYGYRKEFWWEREWRHQGHLRLPRQVIGLCPEDEIDDFEEMTEEAFTRFTFIDPRWGLEQIIARLAGFRAEEVDIL